jgi:WD40 repeat protein
MEHQASPLPENPPIRFKKLFTLKSDRPPRITAIVAFSPDGKTVAAGREENGHPHDVALWDVEKRQFLHALPHPDEENYPIGSIAFLPPGDRVVTVRWLLNKVFLWDVRSGKLLDTLDTGRTPSSSRGALAAFPDGNRVICCTGGDPIEWDVRAKTSKPLAGDSGVRATLSLEFTADGSRFATEGGGEGTFMIWDAKAIRPTSAISDRNNRGGHFAFAPDGSTVAADYHDPTLSRVYQGGMVATIVVGVWDASSGKKLLAGRLFNWGTCDLTYTRDGKYLLVAGVHTDAIEAGGKPVIGVWEVATGRLVNAIRPGPSAIGLTVSCIAVSPDNKFLAVPAGGGIEIYAIEYAEQPKPKGG